MFNVRVLPAIGFRSGVCSVFVRARVPMRFSRSICPSVCYHRPSDARPIRINVQIGFIRLLVPCRVVCPIVCRVHVSRVRSSIRFDVLSDWFRANTNPIPTPQPPIELPKPSLNVDEKPTTIPPNQPTSKTHNSNLIKTWLKRTICHTEIFIQKREQHQ